MFKGFFWKIWFLGIFCSIFAICLMLFGLANYYLKGEEKEMLRRNYLLAQVVTHEVESGYLKGMWPYKILKMVSDPEDISFLWVVKPNGEIFWADQTEMFGKVFQDQFLGSEEAKNRNSYFNEEKIKLIAHPLKIELKGKPWTLFLGISFQQLRKAQREVVALGMGFFVLIAILISFISYYFSKTMTRPLEVLRRGAEIIGKGDLDHRIKLKTNDEIEELGKTFNQMAGDLKKSHVALEESSKILEVKVKARTKELEELTNELENKVSERTKQLKQRLEELERFHRLTVGRELKMVELKKELKILRNEIPSLGRSVFQEKSNVPAPSNAKKQFVKNNKKAKD